MHGVFNLSLFLTQTQVCSSQEMMGWAAGWAGKAGWPEWRHTVAFSVALSSSIQR